MDRKEIKEFMMSQRDEEFNKKLETFVSILNSEPEEDRVEVLEADEEVSYLPISYVENELDQLFMGIWDTINFKWDVPFGSNKLVGSLELKVFHPVHSDYISRTGAAVVELKRKKNNSDNTSWAMDLPHLKAECLKNACKSLGNRFGRNLNRIIEDKYQPYVNPELAEVKKDKDEKYQKWVDTINKYKTPEILKQKTPEIIDQAEKSGVDAKRLNSYITERMKHLNEGK